MAPVLKTGVTRKGTGGSNHSLSATSPENNITGGIALTILKLTSASGKIDNVTAPQCFSA
jgi:hypothetical protein